MLAHRGKTGRLMVRSGNTEGAFFFDRGRLRGMMGRGGAAIAPVARTAQDSQTSPWPEAGVELTASLLRAPHVAFVFEPDIVWPETSSPAPRGRVNRLLEEGGVRVGQWREVERVIPSLDLRPTLVIQITAQVVLEPDEWRLLTAIDGRRSVTALSRAAGLSPLTTCQRLVRMLERGLIALEAPAAPRASAGEIVQMPEVHEPVVTQVQPETSSASLADGVETLLIADPSSGGVPPSVLPRDGAMVAAPNGVGIDGSGGSDGARGRRWQRRSVRRTA